MKKRAAWTLLLLIGSVHSGIAEPIPIGNLADLQKIGQEAEFPLDGDYALSDHIDASATAGWNEGEGFVPIGTQAEPFIGVFDGQGYVISNLTMVRTNLDYVGLFGSIGTNAAVGNLSLIAAEITGKDYVGGLAGRSEGIITNCHVEGASVTGRDYAGGLFGRHDGAMEGCRVDELSLEGRNYLGGLAGYNGGSIERSRAEGTVVGTNYVGGIAGLSEYGLVSRSYATGEVRGNQSVGGLVGYSYAATNANSYAVTTVRSLLGDGFDAKTGGLVGDFYAGRITNCYAAGSLMAQGYNAGGLVGYRQSGIVTNSFTPQTPEGAGTALMQAQMMERAVFEGAGWDFTEVWAIDDGASYPVLQDNEQVPPPSAPAEREIGTLADLDKIGREADYPLSGSYRLTADLDASETAGWNEGEGFAPIGSRSLRFSGVFNGQRHVISNLTVVRTNMDYVGLFRHIGTNAAVENVVLSGGSITGRDYVGGIAGRSDGVLLSCGVDGLNILGRTYVGGIAGYIRGEIKRARVETTVVGTNYVGGIAGLSEYGLVSRSYATGEVRGNQSVGGLVGYSYAATNANSYAVTTVRSLLGDGFDAKTGGLVGDFYAGRITNCYAAGSLMAQGYNAGGLVGYRQSGIVTNSFTPQTPEGAGTALMQAQMMERAVFEGAGWDFTEVWAIDDGASYPVLQDNEQVPPPSAPAEREIGTLADLDKIGREADYPLSGSYRLTADLDASETAGWNEGEGFAPIGSRSLRFSGVFNGQRHVISNLTVVRTNMDYVGLFRHIGTNAAVENVVLSGGEIAGRSYVGGVAGWSEVLLQGCGVDGLNILGSTHVGGIAGYSRGGIERARVAATVIGTDYVGGIAGMSANSLVSRSYAAGEVRGRQYVGGLVGYSSYATNANSYAVATVRSLIGDGFDAMTGGLVGYSSVGLITNCYAAGAMMAQGNFVGGLLGAGGTATSSFTPQASARVEAVLTQAQMMERAVFEGAGWDFAEVWAIDDGASYPVLQDNEQVPRPAAPTEREIGTLADLNKIGRDADYPLSGSYRLTAALDASETAGWNEGEGFEPIGYRSLRFSGIFDGQGHVISNLTIVRTNMDYVGLFRHVETNMVVTALSLVDLTVEGRDYVGGMSGWNAGMIEDCQVESAAIVGRDYVGGMIGQNIGNISDVFVKGISAEGRHNVGGVSGHNGGAILRSQMDGLVIGTNYVGGIAGCSEYGLISRCYALGDVRGSQYIGGLLGYSGYTTTENSFAASFVHGIHVSASYTGGLIGWLWGGITSNCFSMGSVTGETTESVGGLVGVWAAGNAPTNSYWDIEASGQIVSGGVGIGRTTEEMTYPYDPNTYVGWDFAEVWNADVDGTRNGGYPYLRSPGDPLDAQVFLLDLAQTYDGTARTVTATTMPAGLTVEFTYDGSPEPPVGAGSYAVTGTVNDAVYQGAASDTLVVSKATPSVTIWPVAGQSIAFGQTLADAGLDDTGTESSVPGTYAYDDPSIAPPVGDYEADVTFTPDDDANYTAVSGMGAVTVTVGKASAQVFLLDLAQTYDGTARTVTATTMPAGLTVEFTYDGSPEPPVGAGSYAVTGTVNDAVYQGAASDTLVVSKATPSVTIWPVAGQSIAFGQTLADAGLDDTGTESSVPGTYAYDDPSIAPPVGDYEADVTFTPDDDANYTAVSGMGAVTVTVGKASAQVFLLDLAQTYDGTARTVTATTMPAGLTVEFTYDGSPEPPVGAGSYAVTGTVNDAVYQGAASDTLVVSKATPSVTIWPVAGQSIAFGQTLADAGLDDTGTESSVPGTYAYDDPSIAPPVGDYEADVTFTPDDDANYTAVSGMGAVTVTVGKASAQVFLLDLAQTYDGTARTVTATTMPAGLTVEFTYDGSPEPPVGAGSYAVTGTVNDAVYQGAASDTLVVSKATPSVTIWPVAGQSIAFGQTLADAGLDDTGTESSVPGTYAYDDPSIAPPVGDYEADVTFTPDDDANYTAVSGMGAVTVTVLKAEQTIDFQPIPDQVATNVVALEATATSGLEVEFMVEAGSPAILEGLNLTFTGTGQVAIVASQVGDDNWHAAPEVTQVFDVTKVQVGVALEPLAQTYDGTPRVVSATTVPDGLLIEVTYDGIPEAPTDAGVYSVTGRVTEALYEGMQTGTLVVAKAAAQVYLLDLVQTYDGTARTVTATTMPAGLIVEITYDGSPEPPVGAGSYAVTGTVSDLNHAGSGNGTLVVNRADQLIDFPAIGNQMATDTVELHATAASGLEVEFTVIPGSPAVITGETTLSFTGPGEVGVVARQGGDANWHPTPDVTNWFTVSLPMWTLEIQSGHGLPNPSTGRYEYAHGTLVTNVLANGEEIAGLTRYLADGAEVSGAEGIAGTSTSVVVRLTNDAVLSWQWTTNYWLSAGAGPHGAVDAVSGWREAGSPAEIEALPELYYEFTRWLGVGAGQAGNNPLELTMDAPRSVQALFVAQVTAGTGTPLWWLADQGWTGDFEAAALDDPDEDGSLNWQEEAAGTDPTDPESIFHFHELAFSATDIGLRWPSVDGRIYQVEYSTNMTMDAWEVFPGGENVAADPPENRYDISVIDLPERHRMFRVTVQRAESPVFHIAVYQAGPNGYVEGESYQTIPDGGSGAVVEAVPDEGVHFVRWSDGSVQNPRRDVNVVADIQVTAEFALGGYGLDYMAGDGGTIEGDASQTTSHGESGTPVRARADEGYYFVQWSDGITDNPRLDLDVKSLVGVTAVFSTNRFTDHGDGTVSDHASGLMWVQAPHALPGNTWMTGDAAASFCESLNHAGYADWRLPAVQQQNGPGGILHPAELDAVGRTGAVMSNAWDKAMLDDVFSGLLNQDYWSGTLVSHSSARWAVRLSGGHLIELPGGTYSVWPVRGTHRYIVTFDLAGKGVRIGGGPLAQLIEHGQGAQEPLVEADEGWVFTGWDIDVSQVTGDLVATAQYQVPPPAGMVHVPGGTFSMGDAFGEGSTNEMPVHSVTVDGFFMGRYEVTKAEFDEVYNWAIQHGYSFHSYCGWGKDTNHPVYMVRWFDALKWCNAKSEKEGLSPAYYTNALRLPEHVYRTGDVAVSNDSVDWDSGYRLPTEAEWEYAARGGHEMQRFPWGASVDDDKISHDHANYQASRSNTYAYEISPYSSSTYHPTYTYGATPYTSPVGRFAPNGFGVYDMAGNVSEWCWDWRDDTYYSEGSADNPRGPSSGNGRVHRGGGWSANAYSCRTAYRTSMNPTSGANYLGIRLVISASP